MTTLKQIETFYWVARLRGFVLAAEKLNSTQATVSMRIRDLEQSLGITLFDRSQRSAQLTPKGKELLRYAEQMIELSAQIQERVCDPEVLSISFRIGVTELVAVTWLPQLVRAINEAFPRVLVELGVDLTFIQHQKLSGGDLDMAILPGPIDTPGLQGFSLGNVECAWMASPKLDIPDTTLTPDQFSKWSILMTSKDSHLHKIVLKWLDQHDGLSQRSYLCNSIGVLGSLTREGMGVSYLPIPFFEKELREKTLRVFDAKPDLPDLEYFAVIQNRGASPLAGRIAELAQKCSTFQKAG